LIFLFHAEKRGPRAYSVVTGAEPILLAHGGEQPDAERWLMNEAFQTFIDQHHPDLLKYCCRLAGTNQGWDLLQDVLLVLLGRERLGEFHPANPGAFGYATQLAAWLFSSQRRRKHPTLLGPLEVADQAPEPWLLAAQYEQNARLSAAVAQLDDVSRQIVNYHLAGMFWREISDILQIPLGTVFGRWQRQILPRLRQELTDDQ
jgi:RNA polymerase sigma factor (sigma-70 family)